MKVWLNQTGELAALGNHIVLEGDELVSERAAAEVIISDPTSFPSEFMKSIYGEEFRFRHPKIFLSRLFKNGAFQPETFFSIPFQGVMNSNLGLDKHVGSVGGYCEVSEQISRYLDNKELLPVLSNLHHQGYVSFGIGMDQSKPYIARLTTGVPSYGLYAAFEGLDQKISEHFYSPFRMKESWVGAMVLTRYPWPMRGQDTQFSFELDSGLQKRLWLFPEIDRFKHGAGGTGTKIGVVTGWSTLGLANVARKVLWTLDGIPIQFKQYRTDLKSVVIEAITPFVADKLLSLTVRSPIDKISPTLVGYDPTGVSEGVE